MLTVACVLKHEPGSPFGGSYVMRLAEAVRRWLTVPYQFVCLTDVPGMDLCLGGLGRALPLSHGWRGWWSKMEIFRLPGPVLYLDLDTVIVGSMDEMAQAVIESDRILFVNDFYHPGDRNSSMVGWGEDVSTEWILDSFIADLRTPPCYVQTKTALRMTFKTRTFRGDQDWLGCLLDTTMTPTSFFQDVVPGLHSYKVDVRDKGLPADARVVCFHGEPRPHMVDEPWMARPSRAVAA